MVNGTIIRAGTLNVNGEKLTGFFVECASAEIMEIARQEMYNKKVAVYLERRKTPRPKWEGVKK